MKILLDSAKPFYKANLHCHTTFSDGKCTPEEIKDAYKSRGYSIVAFTDHEHLIDHSNLNDEDFLAITSCEVAIKEFPEQSTLKNFNMKVCHLNFYALDPHNTVTPCYSSVYDHYIKDEFRDLIRYEEEYERIHSTEGINAMIAEAKKQGFIVAYNHPSWSLETTVDYMGYKGLFAVEVFNAGCSKRSAHPDDEAAFAALLRAGNKLYCTACDDNHNSNPDFDSPYSDSFGGWVCINAARLDYAVIMDALQKGDFYASTGPEIFSLTQDGNKVKIQTSPCRKLSLLTRGRRCAAQWAAQGETITEAEFELRESDGYFRIRIEDEQGYKAYTQAYDI